MNPRDAAQAVYCSYNIQAASRSPKVIPLLLVLVELAGPHIMSSITAPPTLLSGNALEIPPLFGINQEFVSLLSF